MASIPNVTTNATGTGLGNVTGNVTGNIAGGFPAVQWQGWTTLSLVGCMLVALVAELAPPYMIMMGTLIIFLPLGILTVEDAFHGFADEAMLAVGVLFIVAKGIEQSGGLEYVSSVLFSTKKSINKPGQRVWKSANSIVWVLVKFSVPVAIFSAFLANIPLVAMMIPPIVEFSKKVNMAPSKLLLPLSFAALMGGTMTLIGASTNLVVLSMAAKKVPDLKMNIFEIGVVGVPITVAGLLYIFALSGKLLPDRLTLQNTTFNAREYSVVLVIKPTSSLANKTVEQAGLNRQPGLTLLQIERDGMSTINPPGTFVMLPKDHLHFTGVIDSVLSLTQLDGLALSEDEGQQQVDLNQLTLNQCLVEAVIAAGSPMVRKRVAELQFRARYKAAIVAVHRHAKVINCPIGMLELAAGDCLLMVADGSEFVSKHRNNSTFALVAKLPGFVPIQRRKASLAAIIVVAMVIASAIGVELITAGLFACAGLLIFRCLTPRDAMDALEMPVLIMISAAFGISEAMVQSGAADVVARALMGLAGKSVFGLISCTYIATTVFSLAITNNAAVTIMFPVALAAASQQNLDFKPFAYTLMMASSAGFMTPTGCSTNIMVYAPGGYKFVDYLKYGGLLQLWLLFVTVGVTVTIEYWWAWWLAIIPTTLALTPLLAGMKCNMPRPLPVILSEHLSNEHPTSRLLNQSNLDSAAIDIAESSNARGGYDSVDLSPKTSNVNSESKLTLTGQLKETTNFTIPEAAGCCGGPGVDILLGGDQKVTKTATSPAAARSSYSSISNNNTSTSTPALHPLRQSISLEKLRVRDTVVQAPSESELQKRKVSQMVPYNFQQVSGFAMAAWGAPPSGYLESNQSINTNIPPVVARTPAVLQKLPLDDYRNTPPPPYPGDINIDRMSGDENDQRMRSRRMSDSYFIASPRVTITAATTTTNAASTSNSPSRAGTATSELQSPTGGNNSSSQSPLFQDNINNILISRQINPRNEAAASSSDGSRRSSIDARRSLTDQSSVLESEIGGMVLGSRRDSVLKLSPTQRLSQHYNTTDYDYLR